MKILTYEDYLNSSLNEINQELKQSYLYTENEILNFRMFARQFANEIGKYEEIIKKFDQNFYIQDNNKKCREILKFYQETINNHFIN